MMSCLVWELEKVLCLKLESIQLVWPKQQSMLSISQEGFRGRKDLVGAPAHNKVDGIPYCDT